MPPAVLSAWPASDVAMPYFPGQSLLPRGFQSVGKSIG